MRITYTRTASRTYFVLGGGRRLGFVKRRPEGDWIAVGLQPDGGRIDTSTITRRPTRTEAVDVLLALLDRQVWCRCHKGRHAETMECQFPLPAAPEEPEADNASD